MALTIEPYMDLLWFKEIYGKRFRDKAEAAAYYLAEGEQRGELPNPLFDPGNYRARAKLDTSQSALMHYLAHKTSGGCSRPSKYFDAEWYQWQNSDVSEFGCSVLHYLNRGGREFRDPSPEVDMVGLSRSHGHLGDGCVLTYMLSSGHIDTESNLAVTPSETVLIARQRLFLRESRPSLLKCDDRSPRENLLFVQCARDSEFWSWFEPGAHRDWDLFLNCYAGNFPETDSADYVCVQRGTKFTGILNCWLEYGAIFERYENVFFIDDDLIFEFSDISRFFSLMKHYKLDLAQPSLMPGSQCIWPDFFNFRRSGVRKTNAVEIMMPAMSWRARRQILPYFAYSISGFGLDFLMAKLAERGHLSSGVVDDIVVRHEKKIDQAGGAYYEFLRSRGINSKYELWRLITKFGLDNSLHALN